MCETKTNYIISDRTLIQFGKSKQAILESTKHTSWCTPKLTCFCKIHDKTVGVDSSTLINMCTREQIHTSLPRQTYQLPSSKSGSYQLSVVSCQWSVISCHVSCVTCHVSCASIAVTHGTKHSVLLSVEVEKNLQVRTWTSGFCNFRFDPKPGPARQHSHPGLVTSHPDF